LNLRKVTTEISETPIRIGQSKFRFYDVPGQRGYRKQWIQFFDNASAVMFVTSLTFYREYLKKEESPDMPNALLDSVECFRDINKSPLMKHDMCVLIMSKFDLIGRLMQTDRIEKHFPEVAGHYGDFITAEDKRQFVTFVSKKFEKVLPKNREFAAHIVTCNDTGAVSAVLHSITQNIVFRILKTNGIF
jgi:guanine nucleotide-binding protein G(i) subunit alpha